MVRDTFKDTSIAPHPNQWCTPPHQSGVIRAVHAWMPTCACVVALPRDGQELRRLNAVAARCRHTSTRPGCTQTEHGRLHTVADRCPENKTLNTCRASKLLIRSSNDARTARPGRRSRRFAGRARTACPPNSYSAPGSERNGVLCTVCIKRPLIKREAGSSER